MNEIIKYIIATVGTLLLLGAIAYGIFIFTLINAFAPEPVKETITEEWDTEGLRKVKVVKYRGNATVNPGLHIAVYTVNENGNSGKAKEIFIADKSFLNEDDLIIKWQSTDTLLIKYQKDLRIFRKEPELTYLDSTLNFKIIYKEKE
jgi:hypothetical protein